MKFLAPFVLILSALVATVAFIEYREQRDQINETYVEKGQTLARALSSSLENPRNRNYLDDSLALQEQTQYIRDLDPAVLRVNIYMPYAGGVITIASSDTLLVGKPASGHDAEPLETGESETEETRLDGEKVLEISSPVRVDGEIVAALGVYTSLSQREEALSALTTRLVVGPVIAVLLITALGWIALHFFVLNRLKLMVRSGDRLAQGDMTTRIAGDWANPGRDEMAIAISHFNNMAGSIQSLTTTLELLGVTDGLTGVHNRRFFDETLTQEVSRSQRSGAPLALMMLDIDHFKRYNDRFGHQAGDEALRRVAQALSREVRSVDFVARYGGEEFAVIMPGADSPGSAVVAERVRRAVESRGIPSPDGGPLTVSIGVAVYPDLAGDGGELVSAADGALYIAKDGGRNRVVLAADRHTSS